MPDIWVSTVTALVAVVGLAVSAYFSTRTIWDNRRKGDQEALNRASDRLASEKASDRILGLEVVLGYVPSKSHEISKSAQRLALASMQYETSSFVTYRAAEGLAAGPDVNSAISDTLEINRVVWHDTRTIFKEMCLGASSDCRSEVLANTSMLRQNRRLLELLVQHARDLDGIDASETFIPGFRAPGVTFRDCDFRTSLLHYSNLRSCLLDNCKLDRCVLVGAYLERARVHNCTFDGVLTPRIDARNADWPNRPRLHDDIVSLIWEEEYDWCGHWTAASSGMSELRFEGRWLSRSGEQVTAEIAFRSDSHLERLNSSDGNDGDYYLTLELELDPARAVYLVGGTWVPSQGVPTAWSGVWWRQWEDGRGSQFAQHPRRVGFARVRTEDASREPGATY